MQQQLVNPYSNSSSEHESEIFSQAKTTLQTN
jgi:hypothetical protein